MNRPLRKAPRRAAALFLLIAVALFGCARKTKTATIEYATVERKTIEVTVEATGAVEPIDLIEVKSKASGQIVKMNVAVGSVVKSGDLLAQIDPRDVDNRYTQALAAMRAAQSSATIAAAQKKRNDALFDQGIITAPEHETAVMQYANATSALVKARTDLDIAKQQRDDATVRAAASGTVLSQAVAVGTVIASATSSVSGGTTLLTMADLSRIRMRTLVSESDIGSVKPGMSASVTVDAFPNRTFEGTVEKIEPQAVVQQSVTMFPVLISLDNENGTLLPGMNGEVSVMVASRENTLSVPLDAVRSVREVQTVAIALGLDPKKVQADVNQQVAERTARRDSMMARAGGAGGPGGRANTDTAAIAAFRAGRMTGAARDSMRARWRAGGGRQGGGGYGGGGGFGGGGGGGSAGAVAGNGGSGGRGMRAQVAFLKTDKGLEPRVVRLGLSNYDDAEVLDGLNEGDQVALVSVAELQAKRTQDQAQFRSRVSGGTPGLPGGAAGGRGAGGGGGGRTGGGGGGR